MNHVSELYIVANVKNLFSLPFKSVTTQIPNMHVRKHRRRRALIELTAVQLLTEAVNIFLMLLNKDIKLLLWILYCNSKDSCCLFRLGVLVGFYVLGESCALCQSS